jgi:uncharacterized iron-regulated membrane protein
LSGTIYTFSSEIQELIEPAKYKTENTAGRQKLSAEQIMTSVLDSLKGGKVTSIYVPADETRTYQLSITAAPKEEKLNGTASSGSIAKKAAGNTGNAGKPAAGVGKTSRGTTYLVDPYTAEIKGSTEGPASGFFMAMFRMHRWLMLDTEIGRPIVGIATLIFTFIIITGLIIWFPQRIQSWKQGLRIRFRGNWKRINHDLHNTLGFYSSFLLLIMALTGLTWSFEWYKTGVTKMLGTYKSPGTKKEVPVRSAVPADSSNRNIANVASLLAIADKELPFEGDYRISFAAEEDAVIQISKNRIGFFAPAAGDKLQLDQYNGNVLKKEIFRDKSLGERTAGSIKALHVGNVYGTFSKILYFIACLIATSLPVTGTMIWINKLRKKPRKESKAVPSIKELAVN